jgi:hypothetical protein
MTTQQAYQLQTMPPAARQPALHRHNQAQSRHSTNTMMSMFYTTQSSQFHPGLLSRPQPASEPNFFHKLNSIYTAVGLAITLALTLITYRLNVLSWQLSQWTARKDFLELCLELKQAELPLSGECSTALAEGLAPSPTFVSKRWLRSLPQPFPWCVGCPASDNWNGIRDQKDGAVWYGGSPSDEFPRDDFTAKTPPPLRVDSRDIIAIGVGWIPIVALAIWMAWPAVKHLVVCLRRKCVRSISNPTEADATDSRGPYQLTTINEMTLENPRSSPEEETNWSGISEASQSHWAHSRCQDFSESMNSGMRSHGDDDTAIVSSYNEIGAQFRGQRTHLADTRHPKEDKQRNTNSQGLKMKTA